MSDSRSGKFDELASRIKDAVGNADGHVNAEGLMSRIRETVGKAGSDIDTDALMARVKEVAGQAEGKVDTEQLRRWIDEVDRDKLKSWLDEAKTLGAGAASVVEAQGEKLVERAPGAFDKIAGAAKERFGSLTGDEGLITEGQIERFKGQIKETIASVTEMVESETADSGNSPKSKLDKGDGRG